MKRKDKVAIEYPFIMLAKMLLNFDYSTGVLKYKGENISVNKIRKLLNIQSYYRVSCSLAILENYRLCKVIKNNGKKYVLLNSKIVRYVNKIGSEVNCK
jgi:hypothetical protein